MASSARFGRPPDEDEVSSRHREAVVERTYRAEEAVELKIALAGPEEIRFDHRRL
jgi:hypothetical protein